MCLTLWSLTKDSRMMKLKRMRWVGHVACMIQDRNAIRVVVGKPEWKWLHWRPRHRWFRWTSWECISFSERCCIVKFVLWFLCLLSLTFVFICAFDVLTLMKAWSGLILLLQCRTSAPCALCLFWWPTQWHMTEGINRRLQEIGCPACSVLFINLFLALSFWPQFIYFSFTGLLGLYFLCMAELLPFLSFFHFFFLSSFFHYIN